MDKLAYFPPINKKGALFAQGTPATKARDASRCLQHARGVSWTPRALLLHLAGKAILMHSMCGRLIFAKTQLVMAIVQCIVLGPRRWCLHCLAHTKVWLAQKLTAGHASSMPVLTKARLPFYCINHGTPCLPQIPHVQSPKRHGL